MTHICIGKLNIIGSDNGLPPIGSDNGLPPGQHQAIYLNQCWNIVNWTPGNQLKWNYSQNSNIFIKENAFENVVLEMASIVSRPQSVKCDD